MSGRSVDLKSLVEESRFEEAVTVLRAALEASAVSPDGARLLDVLARLAQGLGDWANARWALARLASLHPGDAEILDRWAHAAVQADVLGDALDVRARLDGVLAGRSAERADNLYEKARVLIALDLPDDAVETLGRVLDLAPGHGRGGLLLRLLDQAGAAPGIVSGWAEPDAHARMLAGTRWRRPKEWIAGDYGGLTLLHWDEGAPRHDLSFVVVGHDGRPRLRVDLFATESGVVGPFGPIQMVPSDAVDLGEKIQGLALDHLRDLARAFGGTPAIAERTGSEASALGALIFKQGGRPEMRIAMDLDLSWPEERLWGEIRASNRPYIRRAESGLSVRYANAESVDADLMEEMRRLHYRYDGTPTEKVFYLMPLWRRFLVEGRGELAVYYDGETAVAAVLVIDQDGTAIYTFSRYLRDTRLRVGPFALWNAIRRAKARGCCRFHLGVAEDCDFQSAKRRNIADFKSGFTSCYRYETIWHLPAGHAFGAP